MSLAFLTLAVPWLLASFAGAGQAAGQPQKPSALPGTGRPPTVLFICPHGAAKRVLASAYFQRLAKERGLNVRVESAGTEPDPAGDFGQPSGSLLGNTTQVFSDSRQSVQTGYPH